MNRRPGSIVFGLIVGLAVAFLSYQWITNPDRGAERAEQERVVMVARNVLQVTLATGALAVVDPLSPDRKVGKVYIYPQGGGWEISGYYRRGETDRWHPFLLSLSTDLSLQSLKVQDDDAAIARRADANALLSVMP